MLEVSLRRASSISVPAWNVLMESAGCRLGSGAEGRRRLLELGFWTREDSVSKGEGKRNEGTTAWPQFFGNS